MFTFHRHRRGTTEVFDVLVPEGGLPNAEARFGRPLRYGTREERSHCVGTAVLIHGPDRVEYLLGGKAGLTDKERQRLTLELQHLAGADTHAYGPDPAGSWYENGRIDA